MFKTTLESFKRIIPTLIGLYIAMFWVADARYNNAITRLEARTTNLVTRLESEQWRKAIELVPTLQNRKIPVKPNFFCLASVVTSLREYYDEVDLEVIEELQNILVSKKNELKNLNLSYINLKDLDISGSNIFFSFLENSNLVNTNFARSSLTSVAFNNSQISLSNFSEAVITDCSFDNADLNHAEFKSSVINSTSFNNTNLENSYLQNADFSTVINLKNAALKKAQYNSRELTFHDIEVISNNSLNFCKSQGQDKACLHKYHFNVGIPTKFPAGFDPKAHGMIDVSEIIEQMRKK